MSLHSVKVVLHRKCVRFESLKLFCIRLERKKITEISLRKKRKSKLSELCAVEKKIASGLRARNEIGGNSNSSHEQRKLKDNNKSLMNREKDLIKSESS